MEKSAGKIKGSKNKDSPIRKKGNKRKIFENESSGEDNEEPVMDDDELDDLEMSDNEIGK